MCFSLFCCCYRKQRSMENNKPVNLLDFACKGKSISYCRLAEDMLAHLYKDFGVQDALIPPPFCEENDYDQAGVISFLCRQTKLDQITHRRSFNLLFKRKDVAERSMNDVAELVDFVTVCVHSVRDAIRAEGNKCDAQELFNLALACVVELSLFYLSKGHDEPLKKMAKVWFCYFEDNIKANSDFKGGITRLMKNAIKGTSLEPFLAKFIPKHCVPYSGEDVNYKFQQVLPEATIKSMTDVDKTFDLVQSSSAEREDQSMPSEVHDSLGKVLHAEIQRRELKPNPSAEGGAASTSDRDAVFTWAKKRSTAKKASVETIADSVAILRLLRADSEVASASSVRYTKVDLADLTLDQTPDLDRSATPDS